MSLRSTSAILAIPSLPVTFVNRCLWRLTIRSRPSTFLWPTSFAMVASVNGARCTDGRNAFVQFQIGDELDGVS